MLMVMEVENKIESFTEENVRKAFEHGVLFCQESVSVCKEAKDVEFDMLIKQIKNGKKYIKT